jgi:hypothetical protein
VLVDGRPTIGVVGEEEKSQNQTFSLKIQTKREKNNFSKYFL